MSKIFIDGSAGTTGLSIRNRLAERPELEILTLPEEKRKNIDARIEMIYNADVAFLCLPDEASVEIAEKAKDSKAVLIDTSTAHRVSEGWTYGLPELKGQREKLKGAKRIGNPGCHATGYIVLTAPLTEAGLLPKNACLSCTSLTGYSGGGKKMIAQYESEEADPLLGAPRLYGLGQSHKHLPEMVRYSGLETRPVFLPIVSDFYSGMEVMIPLSGDLPGAGEAAPGEIAEIYKKYYGETSGSGIIKINSGSSEEGFLSAGAFSGRDDLEISVWGRAGSLVLTARYDNLGKGASGAAIQNMNIVLGYEETAGLIAGQ